MAPAELREVDGHGEDGAVTAVQVSTASLPEDPYERAQERLSRLKTSFAASLAIVAEMYRDEDWKYLTREDGQPYSTLAEVIAHVANVGVSMARRYIQGARELYIPLSELTVEGTRIEITSGDVAALGSEGLADAVEIASRGLEGVADPEESERIIADSVSQAKRNKESAGAGDRSLDMEDSPESPARHREDEWVPGDGHNTAPEDADWDSGDDMSGLPPAETDPGVWTEDGDWLPTAAAEQGEGSEGSSHLLENPFEEVLEGADNYADPSKLEGLPEPLRSVVRSLVTLDEMDPDQIAQLVSFETRGVLIPVEGALSGIMRLRALVETQEWMISGINV